MTVIQDLLEIGIKFELVGEGKLKVLFPAGWTSEYKGNVLVVIKDYKQEIINRIKPKPNYEKGSLLDYIEKKNNEAG